MSEVNFESLPETVIQQEGIEIRITIDDAQKIRNALLMTLKKSDLGDRDQLIALTTPLPAWIDADGRVMVGGWLLHIKNQKLMLTYRLEQNEERAIGYSAPVIRGDQDWQVKIIVPEKISFSR